MGVYGVRFGNGYFEVFNEKTQGIQTKCKTYKKAFVICNAMNAHAENAKKV